MVEVIETTPSELLKTILESFGFEVSYVNGMPIFFNTNNDECIVIGVDPEDEEWKVSIGMLREGVKITYFKLEGEGIEIE